MRPRKHGGKAPIATSSLYLRGALTVVNSGVVDIRATYQDVTGSMRLNVTKNQPPSQNQPPPQTRYFTLAGVISDGSTLRAISGAIVSATDSSGTTRTSTTDEGGHYSIATLREGSVSVSITAARFQSANRSTTLSADTQLDVLLTRVTTTPPQSGNSCTSVPSSAACGRPTARAMTGRGRALKTDREPAPRTAGCRVGCVRGPSANNRCVEGGQWA